MAFLVPSFLWALTALAIPVLIHLFQLRRFKRIEFPDTRFLKEVSQQTRSRKKIRHWLALFMRLGAVASLVLAFAQPYLPGGLGAVRTGQRAVSFYIDDSWSMDGTNPKGRLLDQARKSTQDAVMSYQASDRFQVITNAFEGRQQLLLGRDEALAAAAQAEVGPYSRPLSQVMQRQREALARGTAPVKRAYLFTDLQQGITDVEHWTDDPAVPTTIVPLPAMNADNLAVDSVWFATPVRRIGQDEELHVRIRNYGQQAVEGVPLKLNIDGRQRALASFAVDAGATVDTVMRFVNNATGPHHGEVSLSDQPITFDNDLFIAYRTAERLRVLLLSGGDATGDRAVEAVFGNDSTHQFTVRPQQQADLAAFARTDLIVLNALPDVPSGTADALQEFVRNGGSLALFPGAEHDAASWNALLARFGASSGARDTSAVGVDRIELEQPFYRDVFSTMPKNVDLPTARLRWRLGTPAVAVPLLRLRNGDVFLSAIPHGEGQVYLLASPLSEAGGSFTRYALFVTSLLRMAELSRPMGMLYHTIGEGTSIALEGVDLPGEAAPHLIGPDGIDLVPEVRRNLGTLSIVLHDADLPPGAYALVLDGDTLARIALNLARAESDPTAYTPQQLTARLEELGLKSFTVLEAAGEELSVRLGEMDQGVKLWKWFVLAALLFLFLEILIIRTTRASEPTAPSMRGPVT
ncbi:MAG TPA: BatA domain-containing protein [Flavobacteriales bacterium]|nr:BatA domain-containing protein [Flavobacteriales bacterium]HNI03812.1 BatA domain-containing protein [Flavobacteriales bacterium]HNK85521.1 BatA domain-containing protein [Flavobacteriales bacterium]